MSFLSCYEYGMKNIILALAITLSFPSTFAKSELKVGGTVTLAKGEEASLNPKGVLFIFARKATGPSQGSPPIAVLRIEKPKFPYKFELSGDNAMMPGTPFEGPLTVTARYSPNGDALDKSGPQGTDPKFSRVSVGNMKLEIELAKK